MAAAKSNQRSWKNYLLNKRYQLRFTLFMTGLCAILMGLLGLWVKSQASKATEIAINNVYGSADLKHCERPDVDGLEVSSPASKWVESEPGAAREAAETADDDTSPGAGESESEDVDSDEDPLGWGDDDVPEEIAKDVDDDRAPRVVLGDIEGQIDAVDAIDAPDGGDAGGAAAVAARADVGAYYECRMEQAIELAGLVGPIYRGERQITVVLVIIGFLLLVGITLYGIVMTHRVAGPLYKISLYLEKLRSGRYDTVYNLRKGDHLVEFYEHFKRAHAGLRTMQEEDLARLREAVKIAERENLSERSPELAEALEALRAIVEEKEKSLG
jgi:hypothetical protein